MVSRNEHALRSTCPLACGLDVIGDHWTLLVVRDLLLMDKHEFGEFLDSDEGISSNILSDRLHKLQAQGLVAVITHPENRRRKLYYLTAAGKDLIHILVALAGWSYRHRREQVAIPTVNRRALEIGPEAFIAETLARLEAWERHHGID